MRGQRAAISAVNRASQPESRSISRALAAAGSPNGIMPVVDAVNAYVIGDVRREITERRAERATGMDKRQWQAAFGPYLERTFATGRFPALATVIRDAAHLDADQTFRTGLEFLLDGIQARIAS
ncbi:TetR/AcrR family transcriptional regulator C-terminal domain-containing protein [Nocardia sp. NPDC047648]|uniref:TetR/AcrR family transcriptional regulator C-terminal domain-containing protein n=1 Tax=Nocardia sp. NPDC047648 TaxID=3155625 RepID=UPI0033C60AF5